MKELTLKEILDLGEHARQVEWFERTKKIAQDSLTEQSEASPPATWEITGDWNSDDEGGMDFCASGMYITAENGQHYSWSWDDREDFSETLGQYRIDREMATHFAIVKPDDKYRYNDYMLPPEPLPKVYTE